MSDLKCAACGTPMTHIVTFEDGKFHNTVVWCPECGAVCGTFDERLEPLDHHWRFPKMTAHPELKVALDLQKDTTKS